MEDNNVLPLSENLNKAVKPKQFRKIVSKECEDSTDTS
jgi:hypothetical protein